MDHRNLAAFARWFLSQPLGSIRPPFVSVRHFVVPTDGEPYSILGVLLYRKAPYQVEQFIGPAIEGGGSFPEHRHPNVDSIEVYITGEVAFTINGKSMLSGEQISAVGADGSQIISGSVHRIRSRDWHGAKVGPKGGSFLSIQKWTDGIEPSSVGLDWIGRPHLSVHG